MSKKCDSDYPDYFPAFLRDFHDGKDFVKAFYVWLEMVENKSRLPGGKLHDMTSAERMHTKVSWVDFNIMLCYLLDFLHTLGYKIAGAGRVDERQDVGEAVRDLLDLQMAWYTIAADDEPLRLKPERVGKIMDEWRAWLPYMPKSVQERWSLMRAQADSGKVGDGQAPSSAVGGQVGDGSGKSSADVA